MGAMEITQNSMIEQVARAMFRNVGFGDCSDAEMAQDETWANHWPKTADHYRALARAAVEAMREPTAEMMHAGATDSTPRTATNTLDRMYETVANIYSAAIDAALSPPSHGAIE